MWGDIWSLLHPPYTLWHLSYVVIGACLAPRVDGYRLALTLAAFFLAVGVAAHALDELSGRPLRTGIPSAVLVAGATMAIAGSLWLGVVGISWVGAGLIPFILAGAFLVAAYNLEWFGGRLHNDLTFAAFWGAFPVLVSYFAQSGRLGPVALLGGVAASLLSAAQRALSSPARLLRRRARRIEGELELVGGETRRLDEGSLLAPLERALRALSWGLVALAGAMLLQRLA
jgi:hypothetical protein